MATGKMPALVNDSDSSDGEMPVCAPASELPVYVSPVTICSSEEKYEPLPPMTLEDHAGTLRWWIGVENMVKHANGLYMDKPVAAWMKIDRKKDRDAARAFLNYYRAYVRYIPEKRPNAVAELQRLYEQVLKHVGDEGLDLVQNAHATWTKAVKREETGSARDELNALPTALDNLVCDHACD